MNALVGRVVVNSVKQNAKRLWTLYQKYERRHTWRQFQNDIWRRNRLGITWWRLKNIREKKEGKKNYFFICSAQISGHCFVSYLLLPSNSQSWYPLLSQTVPRQRHLVWTLLSMKVTWRAKHGYWRSDRPRDPWACPYPLGRYHLGRVEPSNRLLLSAVWCPSWF